LIVSFSPEEATIKTSAQMKLPTSVHHLKGVPHIHVEITPDNLKVNGESVLNIHDTDLGTWKAFKKVLSEKKTPKEHTALLIADRSTAYKVIDLTAAHLTAAGFSDIYFLTELKNSKETK